MNLFFGKVDVLKNVCNNIVEVTLVGCRYELLKASECFSYTNSFFKVGVLKNVCNS